MSEKDRKRERAASIRRNLSILENLFRDIQPQIACVVAEIGRLPTALMFSVMGMHILATERAPYLSPEQVAEFASIMGEAYLRTTAREKEIAAAAAN